MYDTLLAQTRATKEILAAGTGNSHYSVGESLNRLRDAAMEFVPLDMRRRYEALIPLLDIERHAPYTLNREAALIMCEQILSALAPTVESPITKPAAGAEIGRIVPPGKRVFIVHGHDASNTLRLKALLKERFRLAPVVLSEQPSRGRSIIEKFEAEAGLAAFAFALMSPDDLVSKQELQYPQARPNVLFELGWFYGRLGRNRVCIVVNEQTRLPSDLDGIGRIQFRDSIEERLSELEAELHAANLIPE